MQSTAEKKRRAQHSKANANTENIQHILDVACNVTGLGFATFGRINDDIWIACNVLDRIAFGLKPGSELKVEATICQEVREKKRPVIINHVAEDEHYRNHPVPAMYGFQSCISMPVFLSDGSFYGTLCAIDPKPKKLDTPEVVRMFELFCNVIAACIEADPDFIL